MKKNKTCIKSLKPSDKELCIRAEEMPLYRLKNPDYWVNPNAPYSPPVDLFDEFINVYGNKVGYDRIAVFFEAKFKYVDKDGNHYYWK